MSLASIDLAAYTALQTLATSASPPGPFTLVTRWAGQVQVVAGRVTLEREGLGKVPAVFWQWERERVEGDFESDEGDRETRGIIQFVAWVLTADVRDVSRLVKGATGQSGPQALHDQVVGVLNGLKIDGTLRHHRVDWTGSQNYATATHHVSEIRFEVKRAAPTATEATQGVAIGRLDADVNLDPDHNPPTTDPFTRIRSTP